MLGEDDVHGSAVHPAVLRAIHRKGTPQQVGAGLATHCECNKVPRPHMLGNTRGDDCELVIVAHPTDAENLTSHLNWGHDASLRAFCRSAACSCNERTPTSPRIIASIP